MKSRRLLASGLVACTCHLGCSEPQDPSATATASAGAKPTAPAAPTKAKGGRRSRPPKDPIGSANSSKAEAKPSLRIRNDL